MGRSEEALLYLVKAAALDPEDPSPYYVTMRVYTKLGRRDLSTPRGPTGCFFHWITVRSTSQSGHRPDEKRPTNCTFGGEDLTTLYVTSTEGHLFRA